MRKLEEEIWRREAEAEETDSEDDVGVVDGIYADPPDDMYFSLFTLALN